MRTLALLALLFLIAAAGCTASEPAEQGFCPGGYCAR